MILTLTSAQEVKMSLVSDSIMPHQKGFLSALVKDQKALYKSQNWDRFFGNSLFYRHNFLKSNNSTNQNFIETIVALELIALGKHCQWEKVKQISNDISSKANKKTKRAILKILKKVKLLKTIPQESKNLDEISVKEKTLWKLNDEAINKIKHPKSIIYRVENKCG